jgi:hypothetical protein
MTEADRLRYLRVVLLVVGIFAIFGFWPLTIIWPSGWSWHGEGRSYYLEMIISIYATRPSSSSAPSRPTSSPALAVGESAAWWPSSFALPLLRPSSSTCGFPPGLFPSPRPPPRPSSASGERCPRLETHPA